VHEVPEGLEIPVQRSRIERVFFNLITNALEAMPHGGQIRIGARKAENRRDRSAACMSLRKEFSEHKGHTGMDSPEEAWASWHANYETLAEVALKAAGVRLKEEL
jgi:signal transduction histidine kinase